MLIVAAIAVSLLVALLSAPPPRAPYTERRDRDLDIRGNYGSATYTVNEPRRFSCLEALGHWIRLTVLGFKGNASPVRNCGSIAGQFNGGAKVFQ
jgi:hypothetical protein